MTVSEYEKIARTLTAENAPVVIQSMLEGIREDIGALDAATAAIAERDLKIKDLQDTNIKLFLSQTGNTGNNGQEGLSEEEEQQKINETVENEIENMIKEV